MDGQHVKVLIALPKSAQQYLCHIFGSISSEIRSKNSVLVISEILRLFADILTPDENSSLSKNECLMVSIQMQLSPNPKIFSNFFLPLMILCKIWNTLKQKMSLKGYFFLKLKTAKSKVT